MNDRRTFLYQMGLATSGVLLASPVTDARAGEVVAGQEGPIVEQPDYAAWQRIQKKMTEQEVLAILGEPLERGKRPAKAASNVPNTVYVYSWVYGQIDFQSPVAPSPYEFFIEFARGHVQRKAHPFPGPLSMDGKPTKPELIYPESGGTYDHYPRLLDLRWHLSSGKYPLHYEVEHQFANVHYEKENGQRKKQVVWSPASVVRLNLPHYVLVHAGSQPGRWRVKAVNEIGESEWSEFREFVFDV